MPTKLRNLFTQDTSQGSRSTALNPLQWALGLLLGSLTSAGVAGAPFWLLTLIGGCVVAVLVQILFAYNFLLVKDRDALRSESFSLQKLAIQKGLIGDSDAGVINADVVSVPNQRLLGGDVVEDDQK